MKTLNSLLLLAGLATLGYSQTLPKGTEVLLRFSDPVNSKTAKVGDKIRFKTISNTTVDGTTFIPSGTPVTGVIDHVDKRGRFGKNAQIRIHIDPVKWGNRSIVLAPADKGKPFKGSQTDKAAIASGAGLVVLGPLGLLGGYGFVGKTVNIKPGDTLRTQVATTVTR